jgi:hypothetical protein
VDLAGIETGESAKVQWPQAHTKDSRQHTFGEKETERFSADIAQGDSLCLIRRHILRFASKVLLRLPQFRSRQAEFGVAAITVKSSRDGAQFLVNKKQSVSSVSALS